MYVEVGYERMPFLIYWPSEQAVLPLARLPATQEVMIRLACRKQHSRPH